MAKYQYLNMRPNELIKDVNYEYNGLIRSSSCHSITANAQGCCKLYSLGHGISNDVHDSPESEE